MATREKLEVVKDQLGPHCFGQSRVSPSRRLQGLCTSSELSNRWAPLLPFVLMHLWHTAAPTLPKHFTSFLPSNTPRITVSTSSWGRDCLQDSWVPRCAHLCVAPAARAAHSPRQSPDSCHGSGEHPSYHTRCQCAGIQTSVLREPGCFTMPIKSKYLMVTENWSCRCCLGPGTSSTWWAAVRAEQWELTADL